MFLYCKEFTCRLGDVVKVVPKPEGGTYIYIISPDRSSASGVHRESTESSYETVVAQLAAAMQQSHTAYINTTTP